MKRTTTSFDRDDLTLAGDLYLPDGLDEAGHYPAVIVQGSFTSVKEQMPATYAAAFAQQSFIALAFDYAHYGQSAGQPRQLESPAEKLADLHAAVTHLLDLPYVQAVGVVGVCTSASNAVELAATDPRVGALATVAAYLPSPDLTTSMFGEQGLARRFALSDAARAAYEASGEVQSVPAYSESDPAAINYNPTPGAYDYYLNPARGGVPTYRNEAALMGLKDFLQMDPLSKAATITVPTMVVHSDESAFPEQAKALYAALPGMEEQPGQEGQEGQEGEGRQGDKELVWAGGNHYDYYDSRAQIQGAVANVSRFFHAHLG